MLSRGSLQANAIKLLPSRPQDGLVVYVVIPRWLNQPVGSLKAPPWASTLAQPRAPPGGDGQPARSLTGVVTERSPDGSCRVEVVVPPDKERPASGCLVPLVLGDGRVVEIRIPPAAGAGATIRVLVPPPAGAPSPDASLPPATNPPSAAGGHVEMAPSSSSHRLEGTRRDAAGAHPTPPPPLSHLSSTSGARAAATASRGHRSAARFESDPGGSNCHPAPAAAEGPLEAGCGGVERASVVQAEAAAVAAEAAAAEATVAEAAKAGRHHDAAPEPRPSASPREGGKGCAAKKKGGAKKAQAALETESELVMRPDLSWC